MSQYWKMFCSTFFVQHPIIYAIYYFKSMSSRVCGSRISISVIIHYSECKRRSKCHEPFFQSQQFIKTINVHDFSLFSTSWASSQIVFVAIFLTGMKLSHKVFCNHQMMNPESFLCFFFLSKLNKFRKM